MIHHPPWSDAKEVPRPLPPSALFANSILNENVSESNGEAENLWDERVCHVLEKFRAHCKNVDDLRFGPLSGYKSNESGYEI